MAAPPDPLPDPVQSKQYFLALDSAFVALVDGAFADAAVRSAEHLLCRPGCTQCCTGVFAIGPADSLRAATGLEELEKSDAERAARVRQRARSSWQRLAPTFPGDIQDGILMQGAEDALEAFGNDEVCPALDPVLGTCDIYAARPHLCRVFGPPLPVYNGFSVCELCFTHASPGEVAAAALTPEPPGAAEALDAAAIAAGAEPAETILAFVLHRAIPV